MFQHIMFPTDTSEISNAGFNVALNLQKRYGGKITILNVHDEFMSKEEMQYLRVSQQQYEEFIRERAVLSRDKIAEMLKKHDAEDVCDILLRKGKPRQVITEVADTIEADLIVMSSQGRSCFSDQIIGSVAEHVVRQAKMPVLVVKVEKN
ncbi:MAG: universal stress protein [Candidatus Electryonea clarkiae]|nr:universal stress protein [Candidatus Electryonea clarkiae]MDP8287772.1 universal stress protein [Candidatus Electryonea clarkiae]